MSFGMFQNLAFHKTTVLNEIMSVYNGKRTHLNLFLHLNGQIISLLC